MRRDAVKIILAILFSSLMSGYGQNDPRIAVEQELNRLRTALDRVTAFVDMLPGNDFKQSILLDLQKADEAYRTAVEHARNRRYPLARTHIHSAYQFLRKIERLVKNHPVFRIKFRERLDIKIQQAEEIVQAHQNPEALHMLNRAKFFRQKAYLAFRNGQSYSALEYYRLALFFADKAIQTADGEIEDSGRDWGNLLSETEMLMERVRQLVEHSENALLPSMFQKANMQMSEIKRLYASKRIETANQKLMVLHRSLYRMIDLAEDVPQGEADRLKMDLEALRSSLQSLENDLRDIDSPAANRLHFRISDLIRKIERRLNEGNLALARQQLFAANRLMLNMYRLVSSQSLKSPDELQLQVERARHNFEELQNAANGKQLNPELLSLIRTNLDHAERANAEDNYLQASFYLRIANQLILKSNRMQLLQSSGDIETRSLESDLQRLEGLINRIDLTESSDQDFTIRYENSKRLFEIAKKAYAESNWELSKELTTTAINLITQ